MSEGTDVLHLRRLGARQPLIEFWRFDAVVRRAFLSFIFPPTRPVGHRWTATGRTDGFWRRDDVRCQLCTLVPRHRVTLAASSGRRKG